MIGFPSQRDGGISSAPIYYSCLLCIYISHEYAISEVMSRFQATEKYRCFRLLLLKVRILGLKWKYLAGVYDY